MSDDFENWNPMRDDFQSLVFNSYISGQTAANLPCNLLSTSGSETKGRPKLYVDGFPSELTESGLRNFLQRIGCKPSSVKIVDKKNRFGRHFGFVDFESTKEAQNAIQLIKSQTIYKLSVSFSITESDRQLRDNAIEKERRDFQHLVLQQRKMKPKIDIGNTSALNVKSNGQPLESISDQSDFSSHDSSHLDQVLTPLAKTDKLLKVLERPDDNCSFCTDTQNLEHLHFILSEQQVIDPLEMPNLLEILNSCIACGRKASDLKLCSQCKSAIYCNPKCQSIHWTRHRNDCKRYSRLNSSLNSSKTLNSFNESIETNVSSNNANVTQNITQNVRPKMTKTTPQIVNTIRQIPKESTPLAVLRQSCGDNKGVESVPKAPEVEQPSCDSSAAIKTNGSYDAVDGVPRSAIRRKTIPIKADIEIELMTDGEEDLVLCFGRNPFDFYLQKSSNAELLQRLTDDINRMIDELPELSKEDLRIGTLCGGVYSLDDICYRARIVNKVNDKTFALLFIDYGNIEPVDTIDIKCLPKNFWEFKAQAIHCTLYDLVPNDNIWSKEAIGLLGTIGENNEFTKVKIFEKTNENVYKIDLFNRKGESLRQMFVDKNYAKYGSQLSTVSVSKAKTPSPHKTPEKSMDSICTVPVMDSPKVTFNKASVNEIVGNFAQRMASLELNPNIELLSYFDKTDTNSDLRLFLSTVFNEEEMQYFATVFVSEVEDLMKSLKNNTKAKVIPRENDIVVAKASDNDYYRSYVLNVEQRSCELFMFDSGFIETVKIDCIYKLEPQMIEFPVYGVLLLPDTRSGVALIERMKSDERHGVIDGTFIRENDKLLVKSEDISIPFLDFNTVIEFIRKSRQITGNTDVSEEVSKIFPKPLPNVSLPLNKSIEVMALYQEPTDYKTIYVTANVELFQQIMVLCADLGSKFNESLGVEPKVGCVNAVRSLDNEWYRAVVTEVKADKINVRYIDFGNEEEVDPKFVAKLTEKLDVSTIGPLAVKCKVSSKLDEKDLKAKILQCLDGAFLLKVKTTKIEDSIHFVNVK